LAVIQGAKKKREREREGTAEGGRERERERKERGRRTGADNRGGLLLQEVVHREA
jgi:hypothetical protein